MGILFAILRAWAIGIAIAAPVSIPPAVNRSVSAARTGEGKVGKEIALGALNIASCGAAELVRNLKNPSVPEDHVERMLKKVLSDMKVTMVPVATPATMVAADGATH